MKIKAPAKINLTLDILKKDRHYHRIQTILQTIDLHDVLTFTKTENLTKNPKIKIICDNKKVPTGPKNTIYKAINLLKKETPNSKRLQQGKDCPKKCARAHSIGPNHEAITAAFPGLTIKIKKNIPVAAGLGGGSSNAAATLIAVNKIWKLNLGIAKLEKLAAKIGMDVPFFIHALSQIFTRGQNPSPANSPRIVAGEKSQPPRHIPPKSQSCTALGTHYGEKIRMLPTFKLPPMIVAINSSKTGTANIYNSLNPKKTGHQKHLTTQLISALKLSNNKNKTFFHNDFETLLADNKPQNTHPLIRLKKILSQTAAANVFICGSGPAVFAFFPNYKLQKAAYGYLQKKLKKLKFIWKN